VVNTDLGSRLQLAARDIEVRFRFCDGRFLVEVDVATVQRWMDLGHDEAGKSISLVDCREPSEFQLARIPQAILMPMSQWPPDEDALESLRDKHIVVYCHHGVRSLRVAEWFQWNGFRDVHSMAGGIEQWAIEIDPTIPRY
jgi:rhodanese-related sulfurtransferase